MASVADKCRLQEAEEMLNSLMAVVDGKEVPAYINQGDGSYKRNPEVPENAEYVWKRGRKA